MLIYNSATAESSYKVVKHVYALDSLTHELQTLNAVQNQSVVDITGRIVGLEKVLAL